MIAAMAGLAVLAGALVAPRVAAAGRRREVVARLGRDRVERPWLRAPEQFRAAIDDAGAAVDPDLAWTTWWATAGGASVLALVAGGPGLVAVTLLAVLGAPTLLLGTLRGRAGRQVDASLPDALDGIARSLRSGATLAQAVGEVAVAADGRLRRDLGAVVADVDGGVPLVAALDAWPGRCPTPGVRLTVAALALSAESGGAAARAVDGVAATLRANLAVAGEVRAQSSQARMSGLVIALAPLAFGALAAGTDRRTAAFLLRTPVGLACLVAGLALDALAAWWMHRITAAPA